MLDLECLEPEQRTSEPSWDEIADLIREAARTGAGAETAELEEWAELIEAIGEFRQG